jgi:hypothetical protein
MVKKGVGDWQLGKIEVANQTIMKILLDGKWHRYQELLETTGLSSATLSKHLKELEKGIAEKEMRLESGEYPYPVYYRMKKKHQALLSKEQETIFDCCKMPMMKITPVPDEETNKTERNREECLKVAAEIHISSTNEAYKIYLKDKNWIAFQQFDGTANTLYYEALQKIFRK